MPTQDIHFTQIGFSDAWRTILRTYVRPIATHHYPGYHLEGRRTLDFVVRYRPDKQSFLRPHHDASTVTLNVALNQGGVEYEGASLRAACVTKQKAPPPFFAVSSRSLSCFNPKGGGTRFIRQNCTLKDVAPGWGALSPGRLTHLHEGLKTTKGTRYILVSFIDQ